MVLFDIFRNYLNAIAGRKQEFDELLQAKDISQLKEKMAHRQALIAAAQKEYNVQTHEVMMRPDKEVTDKNGRILRMEPVWKLPVPYPKYINEIALVFLYGQPIKWVQKSEGSDNAFAKFEEVIKRTRFDSKIRQCKRLAGAETESAMLFRVFKDEDGQPDVQIRVLAASKGDEIYTRFDQYENLISVAWGYYVKEAKDEVVYHFDIYTSEIIYRCTKKSLGWEVYEEPNFIGKIPIILFQQDKEWAGVEELIKREEHIASHQADTNDYFAAPAAVLNADIIKNMPEKTEDNKTFIIKSSGNGQQTDASKAVSYLTWDSASQAKKDEIEWLQTHILSKTFTPNITLDTLKSISQLSAKALRTVMMLADIKASKHKESHDELLDRTANLIKAIIGNVLDVSLKAECDAMEIGHEWQEPFGEDVKDDLDNIIRCYDAGLLSEESAIEANPLVKDVVREKERLAAEKKEREEKQQSIFGDIEGMGAQAFGDGSENEDEEQDEEGDDKDPKKGQKQPSNGSKASK